MGQDMKSINEIKFGTWENPEKIPKNLTLPLQVVISRHKDSNLGSQFSNPSLAIRMTR